jgi:Na+/glutamate symporter
MIILCLKEDKMTTEEIIVAAFLSGGVAGGLFASWAYEKKIQKMKKNEEERRSKCSQISSDM